MPKIATMTLKQLSVLRLCLRMQRVKTIKRGLLKFRAGTVPEHIAVYDILQGEDEINGLDFGLLMLEARAIHDFQGNGQATLPVALDDPHHGLALRAAQAHYGAEAAFGGQAEQAELLQVIGSEQEGLVMALKTATPTELEPTLVSQRMPRGKQ